MIPLSKSGIHKLCIEEKIAPEYIVKIGRRIFIKASWLEQFLDSPEKITASGEFI